MLRDKLFDSIRISRELLKKIQQREISDVIDKYNKSLAELQAQCPHEYHQASDRVIMGYNEYDECEHCGHIINLKYVSS